MFRLAAAAYLKPPSHSTVLQASGAGQKSPGGYRSSAVVLAGSHSDADRGMPTIDGGTPNQPGFRGVSSSGSLEGSTGCCHTTLIFILCLCLNVLVICYLNLPKFGQILHYWLIERVGY